MKATSPSSPLVNMTDGLYPEIRNYRYPKTGQPNPSASVLVTRVDQEQDPIPVPVPGEPDENYIALLEWSTLIPGAAAPHLLIGQLNRRQNQLNFFNMPEPGSVLYPILNDYDDAWIDLEYRFPWLDDGRFLWLSEQSGWRRAYISTTAGKSEPITPDGMDVIEMLEVIPSADENTQPVLYFIAAPNEPTRRFLFSVNVDGSGFRRVTPENSDYHRQQQL